MKRLLLIFLLLAAAVIVPFLIWGDSFEEVLSFEKIVAEMRSAGRWAWLAGVGLLIVDLFLPVPGTVVMSALGLIYGWVAGGLIGALGSIVSGLLAYGLSAKLGRKAARWLAGEAGILEGERLFNRELGGWIVALSRWMPVLPEVIACLAGISHMPMRRFLPALVAGSLPMGFVFAWIGETGEKSPVLAVGLSAGLPPLIWLAFRVLYAGRKAREPLA